MWTATGLTGFGRSVALQPVLTGRTQVGHSQDSPTNIRRLKVLESTGEKV